MLGAGPISIELAQALGRLGVAVTVLEREPRVLEREEPALAQRLLARLRAEGVEVVTGVDADRVSVDPDGGGAKTVHAGERSWTRARRSSSARDGRRTSRASDWRRPA